MNMVPKEEEVGVTKKKSSGFPIPESPGKASPMSRQT